MKRTTLTTKHFLLAVLTVIIWGANFIAIHVALDVFPPFLLCALRFGLCAFPWVFMMPRPKAPLKHIIGYGVFTFALQFGFSFTGIHLGLSAGLASLVLQVQIFFSIGLAAFLFNDRPSLWKICGSLISFIGIGIVGWHVAGGTTFFGLILTLLGAFSWAIGNMFTKKVDAESPLALVVWGNMAAFPLMMVTSLVFDGPDLILSSFQNVSGATVGAMVCIVYFSTHIGYGMWGFLMKTYPTPVVVPFTLLVPVVGFLCSALFLGEDLPSWKFLASFFVMTGLVFNLLENRIMEIIAKRRG